MIKVATLSYQNAYNYGAVFQVAALQHIIESLGADCDIIDYRCPAIDSQYDFKPVGLNKSLIRNLRANLVLIPFIRKKKNNFRHWMESYKKTETIKNNEQLKSLNSKYDKFVVGSDQVWNLKCHGYDDAFFLNFIDDDSKKIAYAASFGTYDVKEEDKHIYSKYIEKFSSVSVRESRGIELVKNLSGRDAVACMDPVLLAGREFWEGKVDHSPTPMTDYIFVYQLGHGSLVPKFVDSLKQATNLQVTYVTGHIGNMIHYSLSDRNESSVSPERFLTLLSQSKYVVTNSFHATVLSIIFQKQFYTVSQGGAESSYNSRIYNLLRDYKLEDRIKEKFNDLTEISSDQFANINDIHEELSKHSLNFLKSSLNL